MRRRWLREPNPVHPPPPTLDIDLSGSPRRGYARRCRPAGRARQRGSGRSTATAAVSRRPRMRAATTSSVASWRGCPPASDLSKRSTTRAPLPPGGRAAGSDRDNDGPVVPPVRLHDVPSRRATACLTTCGATRTMLLPVGSSEFQCTRRYLRLSGSCLHPAEADHWTSLSCTARTKMTATLKSPSIGLPPEPGPTASAPSSTTTSASKTDCSPTSGTQSRSLDCLREKQPQ